MTAQQPWQMTLMQYRKWLLDNREMRVFLEPLALKGYAKTPTRVVHRAFVKRALVAGWPVPPEVLADYPDLIKRTVRS